MRKYLPVGLSKRLTWEQALARTGFLFVPIDEGFDFGRETEGNRQFLNLLLKTLELDPLDDNRLVLPSPTIDQLCWMDVWQSHSGGAEGGPSGVERMELPIMDSYLAGIARWLSALGYDTSNSCDGHGKRMPRLNLVDRSKAEQVAAVIDGCSSGRIEYAYPLLCPSVWQTRDRFYCDLLSLAEKIYFEAKNRLPILPEVRK